MDEENWKLACSLVSKSYVNQGSQAINKHRKLVRSLLSERKLPDHGWDDITIDSLLLDLSAMDSNNFLAKAGLGEREGRVISDLISRRYFRMSHGIGRSGDISAEQPKAAGSSIMAKLSTLLTTDALKLAGLQDIESVLILPLATGMALTMTLLSTKQIRPPQSKYVIWPRIDQKTCLKCIFSANLEPIVTENLLVDDHLITDIGSIESAIVESGPDSIVCVMSTSSCFAPRGCDSLTQISKLCQQYNIPHIINNAYGVQSLFLCQYQTLSCKCLRARQLCAVREITKALRVGRVDAIVQSSDKNFMVPVGGSIVVGPKRNPTLLSVLNKSYPGRASASAHIDLLITLLHLGKDGWLKILRERQEMFEYLKGEMKELSQEFGEKLIIHPRNPISLSFTLDNLNSETLTFLGSKLFIRNISGSRVVAKNKIQNISGIEFQGYGAHLSNYPHHYLTVAAALGINKTDVDSFVEKFKSVYCEMQKKQQHHQQQLSHC